MSRRVFAVAVLAAVWFAAAASAQTFTKSSSPLGSAAHTKAPQDVARMLLRQKVDVIEWDEKPFEEVIMWLRDDMGDDKVNVIPRWNALDVEGADRDVAVTLTLKNVTVAVVLDEVLDQLSEDGQLTYHAYGNTLKISTRSDFDRKLESRVYEVSDLLFEIPDFGRDAPTVDLEAAARAGGSGGGSSGQSIFSGSSSGGSEELEQEEQELEDRIAALQTLIRDTIAPESWAGEEGQAGGGGLGRIRVFDNRVLIVLNTVEVHEELAGYFVRK